jgi:hypothetical protein
MDSDDPSEKDSDDKPRSIDARTDGRPQEETSTEVPEVQAQEIFEESEEGKGEG